MNIVRVVSFPSRFVLIKLRRNFRKLKDALSHNHCGYIHDNYPAPNVLPAQREVMVGHKQVNLVLFFGCCNNAESEFIFCEEPAKKSCAARDLKADVKCLRRIAATFFT